MVNAHMLALGNQPSAIRELFAYGMQRKAQLGQDAVFDFSIGNPSIPCPDALSEKACELLRSDTHIHSYTPAAGAQSVREAIAKHIQQRHNFHIDPRYIYMTAGAAASIVASLCALCSEGDQVAVIAPYFPEYKVWIERSLAHCIEIPAYSDTFQLDIESIRAQLTPRLKALILNSPNNPTGVIYSRSSLEQLAHVLETWYEQTGHRIYIIADEPYRELVYDNADVPFVPSIYPHSLVCYSYSKSLSLPGERIGYVCVPSECQDAELVFAAICGAGRSLGYVCAPSLFQHVIASCLNQKTQIQAYERNRTLLYEGLTDLGYECIYPQGAFYLWVRALEEDAQAFSDAAREFELLIVPSDSFGVPGWVRLGYCVNEETIIRSLPAFEKLMEHYRK